jgi:hypothetical protein
MLKYPNDLVSVKLSMGTVRYLVLIFFWLIISFICNWNWSDLSFEFKLFQLNQSHCIDENGNNCLNSNDESDQFQLHMNEMINQKNIRTKYLTVPIDNFTETKSLGYFNMK